MIGFLEGLGLMRWRTRVVTPKVTTSAPRIDFNLSIPAHPTMPHCDSSVLHAPGECVYCDRHPDWQAYRTLAHINFTGHDDADRAPCPSTHFRDLVNIERWPGNRATS